MFVKMKKTGMLAIVAACAAFTLILVAGLIFIISFTWADLYDGNVPLPINESDIGTVSEPVEGIENISIEFSACDVSIVTSDEASDVTVEMDIIRRGFFGKKADAKIITGISGGTLSIKNEMRGMIGFFVIQKYSAKVTIPASYDGNISLQFNACDADVIGLSVNDFYAYGNAADVRISGLTASGECSFKTNAGDMTADLANGSSPGNIFIKGNAASLDITLPEDFSARVSARVNAGDISGDYLKVDGFGAGNEFLIGENPTRKMTIEINAGSLTLRESKPDNS